MGLYSPTMQRYLELIENELEDAMPSVFVKQKTVCEAMRYACAAGGKRLRPMLVLSFAALCGGDVHAAVPYACAMEMIHCYSLVHDDLPCMDNSLLRRGRPSTFAEYGEDMALLAGDGLLTRAFEWGLNADNVALVGECKAVRALRLLADAAGIYGMVGGQTIDLESEGQAIDLATLQELQEGKTGALLQASCEMGAVLGGGGEEQQKAAATFGAALGRAFQIVDDILDVTASEEQLGKPVGADEDNEKVTYVSLLGLDGAKALADEQTAKALEALGVFGEQAEELRVLTKALLTRNA
ncbi:MAG: polyprenyl synthetase family protein [Ruminococcaceae bacterium]|nr:polyprenyl synthetase family protein [Oscillospiraceae bacterium]